MPTQHGVTDSEIYRQPGSTFSDADGTFTGSAVYAMTLNAWNNNAVRSRFTIGNTFYQLDPDCPIVVRFLVIENVQPSYEEGNMVFVTVNFVGSEVAQYNGESAGEAAIKTYRLEGRLMDMSLAEHPKWQELDDETKFFLGKAISGDAEINNDNTIAWYYSNLDQWVTSEVLTGNALEFLKILNNGETTYVVPSITWTETTQGKTAMTAAQLNKLGHVSTPRGSPPELTGGRTWMLTGASQEQRGTIYQTQIEWSVSERGGWNTFLYDT